MKIKILVICYFILNSFLIVKAETLTEKIADLTTKVNELAEITSPALDELYPVGSIYISYDSTNPADIFGGTWEAYATEKQLVGNGSNGTTTYTAGNTGGNSTLTLAVTNIPSHTHTITPAGTISSTFTGSSVTTGSAGAHTHYISWAKVSDTGEASGLGLGYNYTSCQDKVMVSATSATTTISSSNFSTSTHSVTPAGTVSSTFTGTSVTSSSTGSTESFSIQNPYITVYMWERTA